MKLMGVDVGTTGVKAAVFDTQGNMLGYSFHEYDVICEKPGLAEQDAELVWKLTKEAMSAAAAQSGGDLAAISLSTQGDAVIPMDRQRRALGRAQLGMDYRGTAETAEISAALGDRHIFDITGIRPHPMNFIIKVMWLLRNEAELSEKVWKYVTYADFLLAKMGSDEPVIDLTMASRSMGLALESGKWCPEILNAAGIDAALLSQPVASGTIVGELDSALCAELGIHRGAKLAAGGHDQCCAALGAGIVNENMALDSHGTAEVISTAFRKPRIDDVMYNSYYPCYRHAVSGMYFTFGLNHTAGILMKWYRDNLGLAEVQQAQQQGERPFEQIAKTASPGPSPLLVLPHFNGSGTPTCDIHSKGAILGMTMSTTRYDIAKGFMDAVAFELRNNLETMRKAGIDIKNLLCVGGGARSPIDLQLKADVTGIPVSTLKVREAACLGASMLAGTGISAYAGAREAVSCIKTDTTYTPDEKMHMRYNDKYSCYNGLYDILKDINHKQKSW